MKFIAVLRFFSSVKHSVKQFLLKHHFYHIDNRLLLVHVGSTGLVLAVESAWDVVRLLKISSAYCSDYDIMVLLT